MRRIDYVLRGDGISELYGLSRKEAEILEGRGMLYDDYERGCFFPSIGTSIAAIKRVLREPR